MDLQSLSSQVIQWHRDGQYEPVVQMLEILIEPSNSSNSSMHELEQQLSGTAAKELATQQAKGSLYTYFGDSLYRLKYFRRALRAYEQALSFRENGSRRSSKRAKTSNMNNSSCDISKMNSVSISSNEVELRHRIHLCHLELKDFKEAKATLERLKPEDRTIKVLASLADLYFKEKNTEKARETYLEILKQDPLRLDVVISLCKLGGCEPDTILNIIPDTIKKVYSWYPSWIQAQCYLHSSDSRKAIRLFETLTSRFERRAAILTSLAEAHYHEGNFSEAIRIFRVAYNSDNLTLSKMGSYAACLHEESSKQILEDLAVHMSSKCSVEGEYFQEPWLVLAHYYAMMNRKEPKAFIFVQKAYKINRYSIEALILLASLHLERKDSSRAITYIMTAQTQAPYRYEVQRILCDAFLVNNKKATALNYAKASTKQLGDTARAFYLYADIMLKSHDQRRKGSARSCLEKAVKLDKTYLPAVLAFTELLIEEKKYDKATEVLNNALPYHSSNVELRKYLSKCCNEIGDGDTALYHQNLSECLTHVRRVSPERVISPNEDELVRDPILGLEADELVDNGDSEVE